MDDKRTGTRRRVLLADKVMLLGGGAIDCTLRDRSEHGVWLKVQTVVGIPDRFRLLIEGTGAGHAVAQVARIAGLPEADIARHTMTRVDTRWVVLHS